MDLKHSRQLAIENWRRYGDPYDQVMIAICEVRSSEFTSARQSFCAALQAYLGKWKSQQALGLVNLPIECYVLGRCFSQNEDMLYIVNDYSQDRRASSPVAQYAFALFDLATHRDDDSAQHVLRVLSKPKYRWTSTAGKTIQAIILHDQAQFDNALAEQCEVHRGMTVRGSLRGTTESLLCLAAMALSLLALSRGLTVNSKSEFLSVDYLTDASHHLED